MVINQWYGLVRVAISREAGIDAVMQMQSACAKNFRQLWHGGFGDQLIAVIRLADKTGRKPVRPLPILPQEGHQRLLTVTTWRTANALLPRLASTDVRCRIVLPENARRHFANLAKSTGGMWAFVAMDE